MARLRHLSMLPLSAASAPQVGLLTRLIGAGLTVVGRKECAVA
jgi:hypothetical protein